MRKNRPYSNPAFEGAPIEPDFNKRTSPGSEYSNPFSPQIVSPTSRSSQFGGSPPSSAGLYQTSTNLSTGEPSPGDPKRSSRFKSDFGHIKNAIGRKPQHKRSTSEPDSLTGLGISQGNDSMSDLGSTRNKSGASYDSIPMEQYGTEYHGAGGAGGGEGSHSGYAQVPPYARSPGDPYGYNPGPPSKPKSRYDWIAITIMILSIYSTLGSLVYIIIPLLRIKYEIGTGKGTLTPQTASLLAAFFAKTIELSFVTVIVAFLGQVLSRRAFLKQSRGFNLAELTMRIWVMQPGSLLTNMSSVRFAGTTFLGAFSLITALMALLYTTASDTLVSPKLQWGSKQVRVLNGLVQAQFADVAFLNSHCPTVITPEDDPGNAQDPQPLSQSTCFNIQAAGLGDQDLSAFMQVWNQTTNTTTTDKITRPVPIASLNGTLYKGYWIDVTGQDGINNVTMAMPHASLVLATQNYTANRILQPDSAGVGQFDATASIPNPAINVLCASLQGSEIDWFIAQPVFGNLTRNGTLPDRIRDMFHFDANQTASNVDLSAANATVFEAPRFAPGLSGTGPIEYNTQIWYNPAAYYDPSLYFLVRTRRADIPSYSMCSIRAYIERTCSTRFRAMKPTGLSTVDCKPNNRLAYNRAKSFVDRPEDYTNLNKTNSAPLNFKALAPNVANSLSLNTGVTNGNASISRLLSLLALDAPDTQLNPKKPSLAEALATLFSNSMVQSSQFNTFKPFYDYDPSQPPNVVEEFETELYSMVFMSGATKGWRPAFYIVLFSVFGANVFCLVYFIFTRGFVTDWTETENLFTLSLNSPAPNSKMQAQQTSYASTKGVPVSSALASPWYVKTDRGKLIISEDELNEQEAGAEPLRQRVSYS